MFFLRPGRKICVFIISIYHCIGHSSQHIKVRKRSKRHRGGKEVSKTIFVGNVIIFVENSMKSVKSVQDLISEFGKVAACKINVQGDTSRKLELSSGR